VRGDRIKLLIFEFSQTAEDIGALQHSLPDLIRHDLSQQE
jgi:hypothetical protein